LNHLVLAADADSRTVRLDGILMDLVAEIGLSHDVLYRTLAVLEKEAPSQEPGRASPCENEGAHGTKSYESQFHSDSLELIFSNPERFPMKPPIRKLGIIAASAAVAILSAAVLVHPNRAAFSQQPPMIEHSMHGQGAGQTGMSGPTMPGQDAFGAVQEIVRILEADPKTDWSKIDLEALRQHLIDMNEVTLKADAAAKPIDGGLEIAVTGTGRTLAGIQRMVPAHAQELNQLNGWNAKTEPLPNGVLLTVTSGDPKEVQHIRGLGFIGLLVSGAHHQPHHLAMAKGEFSHQH
jgi:hypothetical protein